MRKRGFLCNPWREGEEPARRDWSSATELLAAKGCRVVPTVADADFSADTIPVVFRSACIPGRRWYVPFERVFPAGVSCSHTGVTVYVWADTGQVTVDAFEGWQ